MENENNYNEEYICFLIALVYFDSVFVNNLLKQLNFNSISLVNLFFASMIYTGYIETFVESIKTKQQRESDGFETESYLGDV